MVHQHFMLVPTFTVLENIILGHEGTDSLAKGFEAARVELAQLATRYGLDVDLDAIIEDFPVGLQQRVEILKALYRGANILILDEPTGVLTPQETEQLFDILSEDKNSPTSVLMIKTGIFLKETPYVVHTLETNSNNEQSTLSNKVCC